MPQMHLWIFSTLTKATFPVHANGGCIHLDVTAFMCNYVTVHGLLEIKLKIYAKFGVKLVFFS
jgi:hypothetical protein